MAKYEVTIGEEFVVDGVEVESIADVERLAAVHERRVFAMEQSWLTFGVLAFVASCVVATAIIGWSDGSYDELNAFWTEAAFFVGLVIGHYFKKG